MPTTFVKGDFLNEVPKSGVRAFACPVDATGNLDVGVAVAVAKKWPEFATWWAERSKNAQLGDSVAWSSGDDLVYALVIQRRGAKAKVSWVERAIASMAKDAVERGLEKINVPRLWGGASGSDGDRTKRILDEVTLNASVNVAVYEQFIRHVPPAEEPEADADDEAEPSAPPKAKKKSATKKKAAGKAKAAAKSAAKKKAASAPKKKSAAPKKKGAAPKKKSKPKD